MSSTDSFQATRLLHFRDPAPPHVIRCGLEHDLMVLLPAVMEDGRLEFRGVLNVNGAVCQVVLRFEAALARGNGYSLQLTLSWETLPVEHHDYHRKGSAGWFDFWTRRFSQAGPPCPDEGLPQRYEAMAAQAVAAETELVSEAAVQQEILTGLRAGGSFGTSHKEGGTNISFRSGKFVRVDYGESNEREEFPDDASLLACLRQLYHWETGRGTVPGPPSELDRWKLILRRLRPAEKLCRGTAEGHGGHSLSHVLLAFLIALPAVGGVMLLGGGPLWLHRFSETDEATAPWAQLPSFQFHDPR